MHVLLQPMNTPQHVLLHEGRPSPKSGQNSERRGEENADISFPSHSLLGLPVNVYYSKIRIGKIAIFADHVTRTRTCLSHIAVHSQNCKKMISLVKQLEL